MKLILNDFNQTRVQRRGHKHAELGPFSTLRMLYDGLWTFDRDNPHQLARYVEGVNHDGSTDGWLLLTDDADGTLFSDVSIIGED